ncbi:hypothetical protein [Algibacter lectus]|nr:hypothetical protein [Algibacter lectus]MWW23148.1 hypothetical protein [Algibacter lectus]
MQYSSFEKGELFEKFVEDKLFKVTDYDLIHRTNSISQNETRYAEDTLKPDFKFRCKTTQQEFYVEAKFRSGFNAKDMIEVISYNQIERFKIIQKEENTPVYIAIGYGGVPDNPNYVSLIPLDELSYLELYDSYLRRFHIDKALVNSSQLNFSITPQESEERLKESINEQKARVEEDSVSRFKNKKFIVGFAIGLLLLSFFIFNVFKTPTEDTLKQKTTEYYSTIQSGNIDELENYINPYVNKWYSKSNVTFSEIKKQTQAYIKNHPESRVEIQWDTFKVTPLNDDYAVTYNMIYKLLKEDYGKDKIFHLKINAVWSNDLKLKSLYEEKI